MVRLRGEVTLRCEWQHEAAYRTQKFVPLVPSVASLGPGVLIRQMHERAAAEKERLAAEAKKPGTMSQPKYYGNSRGIAQPATYGVGSPKK